MTAGGLIGYEYADQGTTANADHMCVLKAVVNEKRCVYRHITWEIYIVDMLFHLRSIAMLLRSMTVCIFTIGASGRKATVPSRARGREEEVGVDLEEGSWWWVEWDVIDNCCGNCCGCC